jgi:hypothetical protein
MVKVSTSPFGRVLARLSCSEPSEGSEPPAKGSAEQSPPDLARQRRRSLEHL